MKAVTDNHASWSWRNILFFLLIFSLPFSFEYHFSASLGTDIPDEGMMGLVSFIFLASWIYQPSLVGASFFRHPIFLILVIMLGWTLVSTIFSTHSWISIKFLLAKTWYLGAFVLAAYIVFSDPKNIKITGMVLLISMFIVVLIILVRHGLNGFQFADINRSLQPFFRNHVNYSAMLVCVIPMAFAAWRLVPAKYRSLMVVVILILLAALFFSYSRGAWLALPVGIIAVWLASKRKLFLAYIVALIIVAGVSAWLISEDRYLRFAPEYRTTIFHEDFREHWVATYQLKDVSTAERFYRWVAGVRMVKDKWITGYGPNCFYEEYKPFALPAFKTWVSNNADHSTVHNYFLLTAIEQGIPGMILLLLLFAAMIWFAEKNYQLAATEFDRILALTSSAIISMLLLLNFLSDLIETDKVGSIFFLCIAILLKNKKPVPAQ